MHTMLWTPWTGCKCDLSGIQSFYCLCWTKVSFRLRNSSSATFTQYGAVGRQPRMKYATKMESIGEEPGTATSVKSVVCWYPGGLHPSAPFSSKRKLWQWRVTDSWSGSTLTSDWTVVCSCLQGISWFDNIQTTLLLRGQPCLAEVNPWALIYRHTSTSQSKILWCNKWPWLMGHKVCRAVSRYVCPEIVPAMSHHFQRQLFSCSFFHIFFSNRFPSLAEQAQTDIPFLIIAMQRNPFPKQGYEWNTENGIFLWNGTGNFRDSWKWDLGLKSCILQWTWLSQNSQWIINLKCWLGPKNHERERDFGS